ncbi:hypothetical protein NE237_032704 [Protea cynaroides]|uniref:Uncharacterized protein n=1 Tax=Protea cynaroides TaxID=273540 RepID=A0A9Q0R3Q7_9MAGN|nr:hypothetical protein NE237_032704 [Protea cynaroides]
MLVPPSYSQRVATAAGIASGTATGTIVGTTIGTTAGTVAGTTASTTPLVTGTQVSLSGQLISRLIPLHFTSSPAATMGLQEQGNVASLFSSTIPSAGEIFDIAKFSNFCICLNTLATF